MADWSYSRDCRDPSIIYEEREAQDCERCRCEHFSHILGERWCEVRQRRNPFNNHCQLFKEGK